MKKRLILLICALFLIGCVAAKDSEFNSHGTLYHNFDHFKFSCWGYKTPTAETYQKTVEQGWWGKPVMYSPEK